MTYNNEPSLEQIKRQDKFFSWCIINFNLTKDTWGCYNIAAKRNFIKSVTNEY